MSNYEDTCHLSKQAHLICPRTVMGRKKRTEIRQTTQTNSLNGLLQAKRHLRPWLHESWQPLSEDLALARWIATKKLANREMEPDSLPYAWHVLESALVAAMYLHRLLSTKGTASRCPLREDFDSQRSFLPGDLCDPQLFRKREKSGPFHQQLLVKTRDFF